MKKRRWRWHWNCGGCGRFLPKRAMHFWIDWEYGDAFDYTCPHCGFWDGAP